ncbi:mannosyl-oligosaccharide alpha-1,2-mannosidase [Podila minutissima]|uniref:alpha-1,2-Mannosidase n=1 Tax=Podila minutissima TaxID=64525 RepID=A0A9P5SU51_9FUNG|nr:mannosyl-oligosaccharide alpha-1,2-mannosidase [Podila minutissima]
MYKRDEKTGGIPFHLDDNKYSKSPFSTSKAQTRIRLRKRHAVIAFCLLAMTYVIIKSSSTATPAPRSRGVHVHIPQTEKKVVPTISLSEEEIAAQAAAAAEARAEERRRLRKKKKNPPSLFDFMDKKKPKNNKNKGKGKGGQPKAPPARIDQEDPDVAEPDIPSVEPVKPVDNQRPAPMIDNNSNKNNNSPLWESRKNRVKEAFQDSWSAYRRDAWGKDEYHPISKRGSNMIRNGQGFTIVDSLDTILLMGLDIEFQEAKAWVRDELNFDQDGEVNLFETTIRVLGGLLSAYDQSGKDPVFLNKAVDLADRLMGAFDTDSGIPYASVHLRDKRGVPSHDRGISSTSEVSTLQLEFKYLSYLTGDDKYWKVAERVMLKMRELEGLDGLVPIYIDPYSGTYNGGEIRLGSRGDSYYEYLIKQYLQTGKQEQVYKDMYDYSMAGVKKHLLGRTLANNLLFVGEISKYSPHALNPKMDHLVCFLGGTMALASTEGHPLDPQLNPRSQFSPLQETDFKIGEELTKSCYEMYRQTETGLAPEIVHWVTKEEQTRFKSEMEYTPGNDFYISDRDAHNWLRPETVESLFYMWRLTGDEKYRHWGWNIFDSIERYSKVLTGGYSSIHDIRRSKTIRFSDKMETFYLAETLKYLYLLFGPNDVLPLDKYVFNTEAHPLPVFTAPAHMLARTAGLKGARSGANGVEEKKPEKTVKDEEKRYQDLLSQEDTNGDQVGSDEDEEEDRVQPADVDDDNSGADDSVDTPLSDDEKLEAEEDTAIDADPEGDMDDNNLPLDDDVDQGLEDISLETEADDEEGVHEVEVDLEGTTEQDGEQDDADVDADADGETEGEEAEEAEEAEEGEEGEEEEEEEEEAEEDEDSELGVDGEEEVVEPEDNDEADEIEEGGENFGVVNPDDWTEESGEEEPVEEKDLL